MESLRSAYARGSCFEVSHLSGLLLDDPSAREVHGEASYYAGDCATDLAMARQRLVAVETLATDVLWIRRARLARVQLGLLSFGAQECELLERPLPGGWGADLSEALYWRGVCRLDRGAHASAAEDFQALIRESPSGDLVPRSRLLRGISLSQDGQIEAARLEIQRALETERLTEAEQALARNILSSPRGFGRGGPGEEALSRDSHPSHRGWRDSVRRQESGRYALQIGAFRDANSAQGLAERIGRTGGAPVYVVAGSDAEGSLFRVRVGPFIAMRDAAREMRRLRDHHGVAAFVVDRVAEGEIDRPRTEPREDQLR